ncbi:845_t:CDS:2 [Entrophospora sp. SA101]|nr:845_t:CDS:2 [Entrophospora sp. SA101]
MQSNTSPETSQILGRSDELYQELIRKYRESEESNLIKFGVVDLDDLNKPAFYEQLKLSYQRQFKGLEKILGDEVIAKMLEKIGSFKETESIESFFESFNKYENFRSVIFVDRMRHFILSAVKTFWNVFSRSETYFDAEHSEPHLNTFLYTPLFDALFFSKEYILSVNSSSEANSERRNYNIKSERIRRALIPDIKVCYATHESPVLKVNFEEPKTVNSGKSLNSYFDSDVKFNSTLSLYALIDCASVVEASVKTIKLQSSITGSTNVIDVQTIPAQWYIEKGTLNIAEMNPWWGGVEFGEKLPNNSFLLT